MKTLSIGSIKLKNRLFLAPMVDVTDCAYRLICRKYGASMAYTEMIYVDALLHENEPTKKLLTLGGVKDRPVGLQITGNTVSEFKKLAQLPLVQNFDLIDINCGCPSVKIVGNEAGSYLLKSPEKIAEMIRVLKDNGLTVTAKIRLGFESVNVLSVAKTIEKAGADALTIHARLATDRKTAMPDWSWISKVKKEIGIPVIGNGGIVDGKNAQAMLEIADGAMVASAAIGNPLIFRQIKNYLKTGKENEINSSERILAFKDYIAITDKYSVSEISRIKYLGSSFITGFSGAAQARAKLMSLKNIEEIKDFVNSLN